MSEAETIREKVEQGIIPVKAELVWLVLLLLSIAGAIYGMKATYRIGYRHGVYDEKIGLLEDHDISREAE
jgi:hypothetical protein